MTRGKRPSNVPRPELARKSRPASRPHATSGGHDDRPETPKAAIQELPDWRWMTFPVFFALALGLFIGVFVGVPAGIANEQGNGTPAFVMFILAAIFLGTALSRFTTRWILARRWIQPRVKKS